MDSYKPVVAVIGGAASYIGGHIGAATMPSIAWLFESGGFILLVGFLTYGLIALWKTRGEERKLLFSQLKESHKMAKEDRAALVERLDQKDEELKRLNEVVRATALKQNNDLTDALNRLAQNIHDQ